LCFAGYEAKKTQVKKLFVKNISGVPQRLSILPTNTPYFKARYNKKGMLASGMNEVVYVQFTPPEWRYYYDCLRVLSEGGNLNVPVHAYPIMNSKERYLPSFLDLGKCSLGQTLQKQVFLENSVPVAFEYELRVVQDHPDFKIEPLSGDISPKSSEEIVITYQPKSASTATIEVELLLSEFDFQPTKMKVIASAVHENTLVLNSQKTLKKKPSRTPQEKSIEKPRKLPELLSKPSKTLTKATKFLAKTKLLDRVIFEQQFNTEFRIIEENDREKEFKIFQCLGIEEPSIDFEDSVHNSRENKEQKRRQLLRERDCIRNSYCLDSDKVVYNVNSIPQVKPSWNSYQNDEFTLRQLPLKKLVKAASVVMTRNRASKRLRMLKERLNKHRVHSKEDAVNFVTWDWNQAELVGLGSKEHIPFEFSIKQEDLKRVDFPLEFQTSSEESQAKVEIEPLESFDSLKAMKQLESQDFLLANYKDFRTPSAGEYLPIEKERSFRSGAEEEYSSVLKKGEVEEHLAEDLPKNSLKPMAIDPVSLIGPHPTLRPYLKLTGETEISGEFWLRAREMPRALPEDYPGLCYPESSFLYSAWRPKMQRTNYPVPQKLTGVAPAEELSDSDSETEIVEAEELPELEEYLSAFEDDKVLSETGTPQDPQELNLDLKSSFLEEQKRKSFAWLKTGISEANKEVKHHKISLV